MEVHKTSAGTKHEDQRWKDGNVEAALDTDDQFFRNRSIPPGMNCQLHDHHFGLTFDCFYLQ